MKRVCCTAALGTTLALWVLPLFSPRQWNHSGSLKHWNALWICSLDAGNPAIGILLVREWQSSTPPRFFEIDRAGFRVSRIMANYPGGCFVDDETSLWLQPRRILLVAEQLRIPLFPFALALTAGSLLMLWRGWLRPRRRVQDGRCTECGYDLRGLSEPRCPECGTRSEHVAIVAAEACAYDALSPSAPSALMPP